MSSDAMFRRTKSGLWQRILPKVFIVGPGTSLWHQRLCALTKWSAGIASHLSAAGLLELDGFERGPLEITTKRRVRSPWEDVVVHHVSELPLDSILVNGIPCTSPTRTLVDLPAVSDRALVELAVEDALRRGLTTLPRLHWALGVAGGRGRWGAKVLRSIVDSLEGQRRSESGLETRLRQLLKKAGLPLPEAQHEIRHQDRLIARADFAYPERKLAIEAVSYRWHSGKTAWARDQKRWNSVTALGWRVLNVTWDDLEKHPESVVQRIAEALALPRLFGDSPL
jgi:very-short-patch-repair endonuclease